MDLKQCIQASENADTILTGNNHHSTESLYSELQKGINDISLGNTRPFAEAMSDVKVKRSK